MRRPGPAWKLLVFVLFAARLAFGEDFFVLLELLLIQYLLDCLNAGFVDFPDFGCLGLLVQVVVLADFANFLAYFLVGPSQFLALFLCQAQLLDYICAIAFGGGFLVVLVVGHCGAAQRQRQRASHQPFDLFHSNNSLVLGGCCEWALYPLSRQTGQLKMCYPREKSGHPAGRDSILFRRIMLPNSCPAQ